MLTAASLAAIEAHWAAFLGCTVEEIRGQDIAVPHHGRGIFILSRAGAVVAVPPGIAADRVVGPAFIGYLDKATFAEADDEASRLLGDSDSDAIEALRAACDPHDWDEGGPDRAAVAAVGVFRGATLAAMSSYEIWSERIAHIGIVTHPAHRGTGLGIAAVRAMTRIALARKLIAQYRTLLANAPSMAIARRLGFERYATTVSIGFAPRGDG
jgi:GNAT superfamily N-acetyltransferase